MTARVSVVMATHNRRALLARALASVKSQRYRDFEIIVVDDASSDGTASWLRTDHPEILLVELSTQSGAAAARNRGVELARGEIVAFLDDDDSWCPSYLETQVAQLDAHPDILLCSTGHIEVDGAAKITQPDLQPLFNYADPLIHLLAECPLHTLSVVTCRRSALARFGLFDETLSIVHDLDWYLRLTVAGGRRVHDPSPLVERTVPGGLVTRHRLWYHEERAVHGRLFSSTPISFRDQRRVRASRAMLFARIAFGKGDIVFGLARLSEAVLASPLDCVRIAANRLLHGRRHVANQARNAKPMEAQ
jgi:glycosyltransferase involved in cell wall biosynthesis